MIWIKNTDGAPDAVLTMALIGFLTVIIKVLGSGATFTVLGNIVTVGTIDASTIAAILTPTLTAYVSRRYTDQKFAQSEVKKE